MRSSQPLSTPPVPMCRLRQTVPAWLAGGAEPGGVSPGVSPPLWRVAIRQAWAFWLDTPGNGC